MLSEAKKRVKSTNKNVLEEGHLSQASKKASQTESRDRRNQIMAQKWENTSPKNGI
jgi:hypothetical protein